MRHAGVEKSIARAVKGSARIMVLADVSHVTERLVIVVYRRC